MPTWRRFRVTVEASGGFLNMMRTSEELPRHNSTSTNIVFSAVQPKQPQSADCALERNDHTVIMALRCLVTFFPNVQSKGSLSQEQQEEGKRGPKDQPEDGLLPRVPQWTWMETKNGYYEYEIHFSTQSAMVANDRIGILATVVALGLKRLPAIVHHSGLEWRTENKRTSVHERRCH
ncbi:hypothetical protein EV363DRAFT_1430756 [Boletus edulis]|nr:hypothetical protein EV363DRAFT_1430756 [Boletus edulis]